MAPSDKEPDGDSDDFRQAMDDVVPLSKEKRVNLKSQTLSQLSREQRQQAAVQQKSATMEDLSGEYVKQLSPHDLLDFKRPGIQHGVYRNLRLGKYAIEARLDLHGLTVEQARFATSQFVRDCVANDVRCALITHGKGVDRPQPAILKSCIAHWLPQLEAVMAFHSALKQHGGLGATYVLLRKSERKRQENLEQHQRRR